MRSRVSHLFVLGLLLAAPLAAQNIPIAGASVDLAHGPLRVSKNRRFLEHRDGTPFLYLADTAWELFHRLTRQDAARYLEQRRAQGFTVIHAVVLAELDGLKTPNAYGERPLIDNDPGRPNEAYFAHVDWVVRKAAEKGLFIGMLPTWGDKVVTESWGKGPVIFTTDAPGVARAYGRFLGARYRDQPNIIWILGGDRTGAGYEAVWNAMAAGLAEGDGGAHLKTYYPSRGLSSSAWFHAAPWLDFNMIQSGQSKRDLPNDRMIDADYARSPAKPVLDAGPRFENHPVDWNAANGYFDAGDVRQGAYWSVLAGGLGVTYGCHDVWQFFVEGDEPISTARMPWPNAIALPGAWQMLHLRRLLLSRPFAQLAPDQSMLVDSGSGEGAHARAARGHGYAFIYIPAGTPVTVRLGKVSGEEVRAWWFNPRTGAAKIIATYANRERRRFSPPEAPGRGHDWVLVLDDAAREFQAPGYRVPATQAPSSTLESGVRDALQKYSTAFRSLDADAVKAVHPSADVDSLKRAFVDMRSLEVAIDEVKVLSADAASARVSCRVTQTLTPKEGAKQTSTVTRVIRLRAQEGRWVIESFER